MSVEQSVEWVLVEVSLDNADRTRIEPGDREGCDAIANKSPQTNEEDIVATPFALRIILDLGPVISDARWLHGVGEGSGGALKR